MGAEFYIRFANPGWRSPIFERNRAVHRKHGSLQRETGRRIRVSGAGRQRYARTLVLRCGIMAQTPQGYGASRKQLPPLVAILPSYFFRLRRPEIGHHHHVAGAYLLRDAQEASWREDNRRVSNGAQVHRVAQLALTRKPSVDFCGYWQRHITKI